MRITGIDHVVFNVTDPERALAWWRDLLGLEPVRLEEWRRGEAPFVSVRISAGTILDLFQLERSGENVDHIAIRSRAPTSTSSPRAAASTSSAVRSEVFGARGVGQGLYVRDPDGNVVELRTYPSSHSWPRLAFGHGGRARPRRARRLRAGRHRRRRR